MVTTAIFFVEVDWGFHIAVLVPSHEHAVLEEWESSHASLCIDLYRSFSFINGLTDVGPLHMNRDRHPTHRFEIFVRITVEIFVFVYFEECTILGEDITIFVSLVVLEDERIFWELEIGRCWEHLVVEPRDDRRLVVLDIWKVIHRREFVTGELAHRLEYPKETELEGKVPKWGKEESKRILDHLRIVELIVVLIREYGCRRNETLETIVSRCTSVRSNEESYRGLESWLSGSFTYHLLRLCLCLVEYLVGVAPARARSIGASRSLIADKSIDHPADRRNEYSPCISEDTELESLFIFSLGNQSGSLLGTTIP